MTTGPPCRSHRDSSSSSDVWPMLSSHSWCCCNMGSSSVSSCSPLVETTEELIKGQLRDVWLCRTLHPVWWPNTWKTILIVSCRSLAAAVRRPHFSTYVDLIRMAQRRAVTIRMRVVFIRRLAPLKCEFSTTNCSSLPLIPLQMWLAHSSFYKPLWRQDGPCSRRFAKTLASPSPT